MTIFPRVGRRCLWGGCLTVAASLPLAAPAIAWAQRPGYEREHDFRVREHIAETNPAYLVRSSHLGYEVRGAGLVVFSARSREEAEQAAALVSDMRDRLSGKFAGRISEEQQEAMSEGIVSVSILNEPLRAADRPAPLLRLLDDQALVQLDASEIDDADIAPLLRRAAVLACANRAGIDRQLPAWVLRGLAGYLADEAALDDEAAARAAAGGRPTSGGIQPRVTGLSLAGGDDRDVDLLDDDDSSEQVLPTGIFDPFWRRQRIAPDRLAAPEVVDRSSEVAVRYLLEADDARRAPAFLAAIGEALAEPPEPVFVRSDFRLAAGDVAESPELETWHELAAAQAPAWLANPLAGQPELAPDAARDPRWAELQREMIVVLKLARRAVSSTGGTAGSATSGGVRVVGRTEDGFGAVATFGRHAHLSLDMLRRRISAMGDQVATLDVDGTVLLGSDQERLDELLADAARRFRTTQRGDQFAIETRLASGQRLIGWLEDNPERPDRPWARFALEQPEGGAQR